MADAETILAGGIDTENSVDGVTSFVMPARPYPGLRPFKVSEWPVFFGREVMTEEVIDRLVRQRLVVVHGASGCGKSSLIFAGVLPQLGRKARQRRQNLKLAEMRPGRAPLRTMAEALASGCGIADVDALHRALNRGRGASAELEALLAKADVSRVCLYVDQFEELFRFAKDGSAEEAALFVEALIGISGTGEEEALWWEAPVARADTPVVTATSRVRLMLSMRSEFLGDCARFAGFAEVVNKTQYLLPNMSRGDLLRSIREPAELFDGSVDRALAERLVNEATLEADPLPLVQHALMRLWQRDTMLTLDDYETAIGAGTARGLSRLLAEHADEVLGRHAGPDDPAAEQLFRALTDIDPAGRAIRRPLRMDRLLALVPEADQPRMRAIMDDFRAEDVAFLRPNCDERASPLPDDQIIDISHEALLRAWPRIADATLDPATGAPRGWLHREFEDGLVWRSLAVQARAFRDDPEACLDPATTGKRDVWYRAAGSRAAWANRHLIVKSGVAPGDEPEWKGVDALMEASRRERERARKRRIWGFALLAGMVVLLVVSLALAAWGYSADAERQELRAKAEAKAALKSVLLAETLSEETVTSSRSQLAQTKVGSEPVQLGTDLAVWLGSDLRPNVLAADGTAVVPSRLKQGERVQIVTETIARSALPSGTDYRMADGLGYLAKGATVELVSAPTAFQRASARQYWAKARGEVIPLGTVFVQFGGGSSNDAKALAISREHVRLLANGLKRYGFTVPGEERVTVTPGMSEVRFFHAADRDRARLIASIVVQVGNGAKLDLRTPVQKDLSGQPRKTPPGVVELWIDLTPAPAGTRNRSKYVPPTAAEAAVASEGR